MKKMFALALILALFASCAYAENVYTITAVVVAREQVENDLWVITCFDEDGNIWDFLDDEGDFAFGTLITLVIFAEGETVEDYEIIDYFCDIVAGCDWEVATY